MKRLELKPEGFPCKLKECPPGFFLKDDEVGFKSEYAGDSLDNKNRTEAFCESGCYFWGGEEGKDNVDNVIVQPLVSEWIEEEL